MTTGRFITLEGGEGVGKSTQAARLADAIRARGHRVLVTREPGGTPGAEAIRGLLMAGDEERWSARTEALLFAAARADHVEKAIRPALASGSWVISDRFFDSTRAYQGGAGGMSDDELMRLHHIGCEGLLPDRTLLLTLPTTEAGNRAFARDGGLVDRFGRKGPAYHAGLLAAFERMAAIEPHRIKTVEAGGDVESVTARLLAHVSDLL